ncbi:MAG: hypothetical protein ACO3D0_12130 [Ilumatobacteraceae bacterium]
MQPDALNPVVERLRPGHCRQVECRNGHDARQHVACLEGDDIAEANPPAGRGVDEGFGQFEDIQVEVWR